MHIKSKYGNGYHLELLLDFSNAPGFQPGSVETDVISDLAAFTDIEVSRFLVMEKNAFTSTRVKLVLGLGKNDKTKSPKSGKAKRIRLGKIFTWCSLNSLGIIEDYAIGQPTLEQVFLKFAQQQEALEMEQDEGGAASS